MRSRTASVSSAELDHSLPPATPREEPQSSPTHEDPLAFSSPPGSPFAELSPTQTLAPDSPELPPLPPFPAVTRVQQTPINRPDGAQSSGKTSYYTASWGSPYQQIPAGFKDASQGRKGSIAASDVDDGSPGRFNLGHLIPTRLPTYHGTTPTRPSTPTKDYKSVRSALLSARSSLDDSLVREKGDWLSDVSSISDDREETEWDLSGALLQVTPSATRRQPLLRASTLPQDNPKKHKTHMTNRTVRQEDIWDALGRSRRDAAPADNMQHSKYAIAEPAQLSTDEAIEPAIEQPEPEPVADNVEKAEPIAPSTDAKGPVAPAETLEVQQTPVEEIIEPVPSPVRPVREKKKLITEGKKPCWILLPPDVPRTQQGAPLMPLTPAEVRQKLDKFEQAGYSTRGFSHWNDDSDVNDGTARVQNRPVYPESRDIVRTGARPSVKIPNKQHWDDYMNQLTEMKLAALGVSLGGEPAPPTSAPLSRQSSSQYPTSTFSPPPPTSSAASHQQIPGLPSGFVPGHASRQSMASPISITGNPKHMGHMHRQSMFVSPPAFPTQPTPPGLSRFSPQHFSRQSIAGNISSSSPAFSAMSATAPLSASGTKSPISPFQFPATQGFPFNAREDLLVQMQRQQQQLQAQQQMQAQPQIPGFRPLSVPQNLQEVPEAEEEEEDEMPEQQSLPQRPEIANPRPMHGKNLSRQLERDAEKDDYHLDNYMKKEFVETTKIEPDATDEVKPIEVETPAKTASKPSEPAKATDTNDTTPSSKADDTLDLMTSPTSDSFTSGHVSKASSVSKFNVEAKEFKFNPSASFNPGIFSPNTFAFQSNKPNPLSPPLNGLGANFKPAAADFNPSASTGSNSSLFGNQDFSFSTSFNPGASTFQPGGSVMSETDSGADSGNRIFGNINFSDIIKPPKKSKAIPIVRPEDIALPLDDDEPQEDESGRLAQADGRQKRARQGQADGDDVPRFAFPSHPLDDEKTPEPETINKALEKEGSATPTNDPAVVHRLTSPDSRSNKLDDSGFQDGSTYSEVSLFQQLSSAVSDDKPIKTHERKKSSLSATAKPFEFKRPWSLSGSRTEVPAPKEQPEMEELQHGEMIVDLAQQMKDQMPPASSPIVNISDQEDGDSVEAVAHAGLVETGVGDGFDFDAQASFDNIDEVMKQLNEDGSDVGIERTEPSWQQQSSSRPATATTFDTPDLRPPQVFRSDAPSPSPRRAMQYVQTHERDIEEESPVNPFGDQAAAAYESQMQPIHQRREVAASDWDDDDLSAEADVKVRSRGSFFDEHVNTLLQRAISSKMDPLERALAGIQLSLQSMSEANASRKELQRARTREDSDADDEDETEDLTGSPVRSRSVPPNRRLEQIKSVVRDALSTHSREKTPPKESNSTIDPDEFYQAIADVKASAAFFASKSLQLDEVKDLVEDALERQRAEATEKATAAQSLGPDSQHIAELARSLAEANTRADHASEARKIAEAGETRLAKELALAEEELRLFKEQDADDQNVHKVFDREREDLNDQIGALEAIKTAQEHKLSLIADQNAALEATIKEHRASHDALRQDAHNAHQEKAKLQSTLDGLQYRAEEALRLRSSMRDRLGELREEMRQAAHLNAQREARWHNEDQEHRKRYEIQSARLTAEARTRERLEEEMVRLEKRERDAMRLKIALDESQAANDKLEEQIGDLNLDVAEQQKEAERYARQFREARDEGRSEVQRITVLMRAELEASTSQADIVRADLEAEVERVRRELEHVGIEAETAKARHELMLEQESVARKDALREQQDLHHRSLQEQITIYEQRMEEQRQQHSRAIDSAHAERSYAEARLVDDHKRALGQAIEDKERSEMLLNERLILSDSKFEHLQDKVVHLEEKLAVAKDAAQAAVQAARTARSPTAEPTAVFTALTTEGPSARYPEKISPQALRESIAVLQEQLQAREAHIEELEAELEPIRDTPAQLKHRETEVTWLREILDVRQTDLTDLINALAQPRFNREAVKNAAIRIRANLQMELQEKERLLSGGAAQGPAERVASQVAPALASISNFATPKAAQLAAAIGNWRKVSTPSGLGQFSQSVNSPGSSRTQTPSKPRASSSAQSFLSGLMTPPQSDLRRTPSPQMTTAADAKELSENIRPRSSFSSTTSSRAGASSPRTTRRLEKQPAIQERGVSPPPRLETPPLLIDGNDYDQDAEPAASEFDNEDDFGQNEADDAAPFETFQ